MDEQGYFVEFVPKFAFSSKMSAHLKNKDQNLNHLPVTAHIRRGHETPQAESFAHMLKGVNLDIQG